MNLTISEGQAESLRPRCRHCHHPHCHRNGYYTRTGTHLQNHPSILKVTRFLCCDNICKKSFSQLPPDLMPVMRWTMQGIMDVANQYELHPSLHWLSRFFGLTRSALRRLRDRLPDIGSSVLDLTRAAGLGDEAPSTPRIAVALSLSRRWPCWNDMAWQLHLAIRRAMHPLRHKGKAIPQQSYHGTS